MPKPEWGRKRQCASCGTKFYDMQRSPIVCPSCGVTFDQEAAVRPKRSRAARTQERAPAKAVAEAPAEEGEVFEETEEVEETDYATGESETEESEEEDYEIIEDASELGEDDDFEDVSNDKEEDDDR